MARPKKTEETSATATEETVVAETTAETTPAAEGTTELTGVEVTHTSIVSLDNMLPEALPFKPSDVPTPEQEAEHAAAAEDFAKGAETVTAETTPEFFEKVVQDLNDHKASAPSDEPFLVRKETTTEPAEIIESTPEPEPLSARALALPWKETHRVITDDMTCLVMVSAPYAWTHPEWDSPSGSPMLRKDDNGAWVLIDGEPFAGRIVSLAPPAPDRHTHRRQ